MPKALGGSLFINSVCRLCNSRLGTEVDQKLTDHFLIIAERGARSLVGHSGKIPDPIGTLFRGPAFVRTKESNIKFIQHIKHKSPLSSLSNFEAVPSLSINYISASDTLLVKGVMPPNYDIEKYIRKHAAKCGASSTSIERAIADLRLSEKMIEDPIFHFKRTYSTPDLSRSFAKIAYEMAWWWMGGAYLTTKRGSELRNFTMGDLAAVSGITIQTGSNLVRKTLPIKNEIHIILLQATKEGVHVIVDFFGLISACIFVAHAFEFSATPEKFIVLMDTGNMTYSTLDKHELTQCILNTSNAS